MKCLNKECGCVFEDIPTFIPKYSGMTMNYPCPQCGAMHDINGRLIRLGLPWNRRTLFLRDVFRG